MKFKVTYQATQEVDARDRGEAIAKLRDEQQPTEVQIITVKSDIPDGQYL